jgi:hypothetical protein
VHSHSHRPIWFVATSVATAFIAMALALALVPAGASARHGRRLERKSHAGKCKLTIHAEPRLIAMGEATSVFGALSCRGSNEVADQQVTLYEHSAGAGGFSVAGTTSTEADGSYQLTPPALDTNTVFYVRSASAHSRKRAVRVAVQVTATSQPADGAQLFTGAGPVKGLRAHGRSGERSSAVTFTGSVNPVHAGAHVALQRESATANEEWHLIARGLVDGHGAYSVRHTFHKPGAANIRIVVRPRSRLNVPGATTPVSYEISQAQNPHLTIEASSDPISYGESVTITGVLAGGAKQQVTLLARARGGQFAQVATATTDPGGSYTFTQTPPHNILYRVTSGDTHSAALFEGVRYALGAPTPSASSLSVGQPFMVSGTVTPALAGHVIYLERQWRTQLGYHVVAVGTVTAAGTYSITRTFFGAATNAVLRVRIPGDPENQADSSAPFTLELTPAPASSLRPVAPGKLPSAGQT